MKFEKELDKMIGSFFQYEKWNAKEDFDKAYKKWKGTLTLKHIAFLYFNYWTKDSKLKEFKKLEKIIKEKD